MLRETRGLEYTLEILRALHLNQGRHDSKVVHELIVKGKRVDASLSYVQKILPRLAKLNIINSSESGYELQRSVDEITINEILNICDMPEESSPLYKLCDQIKKAVYLTSIDEFYDFS